MALFKPFKGKRADLAKVELHEGYAYFCIDDGSFHTDQINASGELERIQINAANAETLCGMSLEEIKKSISWNDLTDKPFSIEYGETVTGTTIEETTFEGFDEYGQYMGEAYDFVVGATYTVTWDGVEYETVCEQVNLDGIEVKYIGNPMLMDLGEDNGQPFNISWVSIYGATMIISSDPTITSHTVKAIYSYAPETIHKLDDKYIDAEWLAKAPIGYEEVVLLEETTVETSPGDLGYTSYQISNSDVFMALDGQATCLVTIDGVEYTATIMPMGEDQLIVGNLNPLMMGSWIGDPPFLFTTVPGMIEWIFPTEGSHTVSIKVNQPIYDQLPKGYIADTVNNVNWLAQEVERLDDRIIVAAAISEGRVITATFNITAENSSVNLSMLSGTLVDWGDGTIDDGGSHAYSVVGEYVCKIYGVTSIVDNTFKDCNTLTSIVIPDSVTSIGDYAFRECSSLTSVVIGDNVTSIGSQAFYNCSSLTSIVVPDSVTSIGYSAFRGCGALESMTLPFIGDKAGKTDTSFDGNQYPFGCIFGEVSYEGGIPVDQRYLYAENRSTSTTFYIPASLKSVTVTGGNLLYGAFYNCSMLTNVTLGDSVTSIGYCAFEGCNNLTSVVIGNGVTSIGNSAFYNCSSLTSVVIPDSVTSISGWAFRNCGNLTNVTFKHLTPVFGGNFWFDGCTSLTRIYVPCGCSEVYKTKWRTEGKDEPILNLIVESDPSTFTEMKDYVDDVVGESGGVTSYNDLTDKPTLGALASKDSVSKSDVGLGNVENKSSETIRSEITKVNVTTALGYTPPTLSEVQAYADGAIEAAIKAAIAASY